MMSSYFFALLFTILGATTGFETPAFAGQDAAAPASAETISIRIVAGQNGVNILKRQSAVIPVVEVRDRNDRPVAGALVNFMSPDDGASVMFLTGKRTFSAVTELDGRASASAALPVGSGSFQITVMAKYGEHAVATTSVSQTNYATASEAENANVVVPAQVASTTKPPKSGGGRLSGAAITGIVVAIAGGAALGIVLGLRHGKSSSSSTTIGVGTPTAGAPH